MHPHLTFITIFLCSQWRRGGGFRGAGCALAHPAKSQGVQKAGFAHPEFEAWHFFVLRIRISSYRIFSYRVSSYTHFFAYAFLRIAAVRMLRSQTPLTVLWTRHENSDVLIFWSRLRAFFFFFSWIANVPYCPTSIVIEDIFNDQCPKICNLPRKRVKSAILDANNFCNFFDANYLS